MAQSRLLVGATLLVLVLAGCSGGPGGDRPPLQTSSEPAALESGTVTDLGLERAGSNTSWVNTTLFVSIQGDVELSASREVHAQVHSRTYRSGPVVVAVSTVPAVTLLEDTAPTVRDPTGSWEPPRRVASVQDVYRVRSLSLGSAGSGQLLGNETTIHALSGSGTMDGEAVELTGTMATTRHGGDYVTVVVLGPEGARVPTAQSVLSGVVHPEK